MVGVSSLSQYVTIFQTLFTTGGHLRPLKERCLLGGTRSRPDSELRAPRFPPPRPRPCVAHRRRSEKPGRTWQVARSLEEDAVGWRDISEGTRGLALPGGSTADSGRPRNRCAARTPWASGAARSRPTRSTQLPSGGVCSPSCFPPTGGPEGVTRVPGPRCCEPLGSERHSFSSHVPVLLTSANIFKGHQPSEILRVSRHSHRLFSQILLWTTQEIGVGGTHLQDKAILGRTRGVSF